MKILFVCKYNRFRSRIAEVYFKKINRNKKIKVSSAGLIKGYLPLDRNQVRNAKEFGLNILGKPRTTSMEMLRNQDLIIIIADDIPKTIFNKNWYKDKVIIWKIPDVKEGRDVEGNRKIIRAILKKVDELNKKLERRR